MTILVAIVYIGRAVVVRKVACVRLRFRHGSLAVEFHGIPPVVACPIRRVPAHIQWAELPGKELATQKPFRERPQSLRELDLKKPAICFSFFYLHFNS